MSLKRFVIGRSLYLEEQTKHEGLEGSFQACGVPLEGSTKLCYGFTMLLSSSFLTDVCAPRLISDNVLCFIFLKLYLFRKVAGGSFLGGNRVVKGALRC